MMSSQSIVCATCDATVPYGRLSCPACGELLASVAGAARPAVARAATKRASKRATPDVLVDVAPASAAIATAEPPEVGALDPDTPEAPPEASEDSAASPESMAAMAATAAVEWPAGGWPVIRPPVVEPPVVEPPVVRSPVVEPPVVPNAPGAYVPPIPATPAGPPAPARAWAGQPTTDAAPAESGLPRAFAAGELVDAARIPEFIGWLAVAGSTMSAVGFLLPWGVSVIGATGIGYFDRWGLAGPFHPIVFGSLLGVLGLALVRNPIPLWVRVGLPGLGLGALLVGLIWPYVVGLSGTGPGALVVAVGALILGVAGVAALATGRHAGEDRAV
jgi:hypothetical protein